MKRLSKHFQAEGLTPTKTNAGGRKNNTKCLKLEDQERVVNYITNYADVHAVSLPGRVPGFSRADIRLLPSSAPKASVYRSYLHDATTASGFTLSLYFKVSCTDLLYSFL